MAKLYFRYGTVGSAKTMNLLAVAHNYRQQGKRVIIVKPAIDSRFGPIVVRSRAGLEQDADILVGDASQLDRATFAGIHCILVDEAQFLSAAVVEQLRDLVASLSIPVICYGLRTDFRGSLFPGSKRLLELADSIEEIKTTCAFCTRKAVMNLKHVAGRATVSGSTIDLGTEERYLPTCFSCYQLELHKAEAEQGGADGLMVGNG